ncbi:type II secretion system F family protein [Kiloniella antarctica]|uniref:Type II secretion system F family protein n=1 Tax=Kiloniella antarctica TaxID=1550907 RepID=A0ABW5BP05_9PROT
MIELFQNIQSGEISNSSLIVIITAFVFILLVLLYYIFRPSKDTTKERIEKVLLSAGKKSGIPLSQINIRRKENGSGNATLDKIINGLTPRPELLREKMHRAGLQPNLGRLLIISILIAICSFAIIKISLAVPLAVVIISSIAIGLGSPHLGLLILKNRRHNKFISIFPDAIDLMVRGLKAGLPITECIKNAGEEFPDPVGTEFTAVTDGVKIGGKLPEELNKAQKRLGLQEFQFFTVALSIQTETGGNLAETLANLSDILRKRKQMKLKIKAMSSEAKASAYIIGSLPFIMYMIIYMMNQGYATELFTDDRGQIAVAIGLFMIVLGCAVMYKMVKFEI